MKFKIIENTLCRSGISKISFTKSGTLSISNAACEKYNIQEGDRIMIMQDEDKPDDWYLVKTNNELFPKIRKSTGKSLLVNYANACNSLRDHFKMEPKKSFSVTMGGQIKTDHGSAITLITAPLVQKRKEEAHG